MGKYDCLRRIFEENRDETNAVSMANYMKNNFDFFGINAKDRKELQKEFIKKEKSNKKIDWQFLKECYSDQHREMHYFVFDCLEALNKYIVFEDINELENFVKTNQWWDSIDKLDKIIGGISFTDTRIDELMLKWSIHDNMWYRRLAIDHQQNRKNNTNKELLEKIIVNNFNSDEFFINKAIGWSLREYSKTNPEWVKSFINKYKDMMDKLSIKEASKFI